MSNMSYCRFSNTLTDLRECSEAIEDELSDDEHKARGKLIALCKDIAEYDNDMLPVDSDNEDQD